MPTQCCKDTWNKIPDDEPVFIIRGKDLLAVKVVLQWLREAGEAGVITSKVALAQEHLTAINEFQRRYPERCKIPD